MNIEAIVAASEQLPAERRQLLDQAATAVAELRAKGPVHLLAACTHNSRRSQLAQAWATLAIEHYGARHLAIQSCGTEATACNPRTVAALERAGWQRIQPTQASGTAASNPKIEVRWKGQSPAIVLWSKTFADPAVPKENVVALMCCDDADRACPSIAGARARVALHYQDPKVRDGQPDEAQTYDERSRQIAAEMFYLIRKVK